MPKKTRTTARVRVGIDTGGTFTDFVFVADHRLQVFKLPSTSHDPSVSIVAGLKRIMDATGTTIGQLDVVHGTTVGTNALLERRGARIALITTGGFEDLLVIGRQARPELYNLDVTRPEPLVIENLRVGVRERISARGEVLVPLSKIDIARVVRKLKRARVQAVAVSLLFSFLYPEHEKRIAAALETLRVPLSVSHLILPEYREYERTSTVVINAYLQPVMSTYLNQLLRAVPGAVKKTNNLSIRVMQSSGGSISAKSAAKEPVRTILSGPAGGVVGALRSSSVTGFEKIITLDMGGTSTDVALCDRHGPRTTNEAVVAGLPVAVPVLDIHTVGAGGGSIARVDEGGSLRVGPESAGADPGPACYGRSLLPTVTDAHVVLGHFGGHGLLGDEFRLDPDRALAALGQLAREMGSAMGRKVTAAEAAQGVLSVTNTNMERALRRISVERGHDPREFTLVCFGGAGGLHAVELATALGTPRVIAPVSPGALSATGVLVADVIKEQSRTIMMELDAAAGKAISTTFRELVDRAQRSLRDEGFPEKSQRHERLIAMRYKGQSFELEISAASRNLSSSFHQAHRARYGYAQESNPVEIVSLRVRSHGLVEGIRQPNARGSILKKPASPHRRSLAYFGKKRVMANIYERDKLTPGMRLRPPCIVTEYSATTLIPEGVRAQVDQFANIVIEL